MTRAVNGPTPGSWVSTVTRRRRARDDQQVPGHRLPAAHHARETTRPGPGTITLSNHSFPDRRPRAPIAGGFEVGVLHSAAQIILQCMAAATARAMSLGRWLGAAPEWAGLPTSV